MNDRPLHDDSHQEEPLPPVWRRFKDGGIVSSTATNNKDGGEIIAPLSRFQRLLKPFDNPDPEPDEPTGHAEIIQELIKRVSALESRVMLLESLNKQPYFDSLIIEPNAIGTVHATPTGEL